MLAIALTMSLTAAAEPAGFLDRTYKCPDGTAVKYAVFVPPGAKAGAKLVIGDVLDEQGRQTVAGMTAARRPNMCIWM